jgi:hypothetical protein
VVCPVAGDGTELASLDMNRRPIVNISVRSLWAMQPAYAVVVAHRCGTQGALRKGAGKKCCGRS